MAVCWHCPTVLTPESLSAVSWGGPWFFRQWQLPPGGKHVLMSPDYPEHRNYCSFLFHPRIQAPFQRQPELQRACPYSVPVQIPCKDSSAVCTWTPSPKDLHKVKWEMHGRAENWGRNPKSWKNFWPRERSEFGHQSRARLPAVRKGCP